jgi:uncharacterized membrane protein YuzA (DUF378 family)
MIQKLKMFMLSLASLFVMAAPLAVTGTVSAVTYNPAGNLCTGSSGTLTTTQTNDTSCQNKSVSGFQSTVKFLLNLLSAIVGVAAVIMIIWSGFKYITSGGKEEGVKSAKNTIIYAIVGLFIVAIAQLIVHFVLTEASGVTSGSGPS